ncbi:MAG: PilZ domain-containing protein [Treponema sp.]|nr:PilZ domain-containing protein [Treponema sp.]
MKQFAEEQRKNRRYPSIALVKIPQVFSGDAFLKDISITGCRIECTMHVDIETNSQHTIKIYPEENTGIDEFSLMAECKWIHPGGYSCDIGFVIKKSPGKKDFERYVDYLSWRRNA